MKTITGTATAWMTERDVNSNCFDRNRVSAYMFVKTDQDMTSAGWTNCGTAEITMTVIDDEQIVNNMVTALKATKKQIQATAQMEINKIDERIQSLLCIEHKEVV